MGYDNGDITEILLKVELNTITLTLRTDLMVYINTTTMSS
jgi:hypothetical protein